MTAKATSGAAVCGGAEGCAARNPWPLYPVRHRGVLSRLCTSCVLRQHPASFCCSCFDLLDTPGTSPPGRSLARCANCSAVAHLDCLREPDVAAFHYLCPSCSNPRSPFSYSNPGHAIDLLSSKMIVAAACLSATSMARAAETARADAEWKARDAALGRKRAKEMIGQLILVAGMEKESASAAAVVPLATGISGKAAKPRKKVGKVGSSDVSANKKFQDRQREKLMRFQEPVKLEHRPLDNIKELNKPPAVNGSSTHGSLDAKAQGGSLARVSNNVKKQERTKVGKGLPLNSQDVVIAKENEKGMAVEADKGSRKTQPTKDAPVLMTNSKDIAKGPPNAQSFRS